MFWFEVQKIDEGIVRAMLMKYICKYDICANIYRFARGANRTPRKQTVRTHLSGKPAQSTNLQYGGENKAYKKNPPQQQQNAAMVLNNQKQMSSRKHKAISLEEKKRIIMASENKKQSELVKDFNKPRSTIQGILEDKKAILRAIEDVAMQSER
uniref:HTH psq-type domain-containing protein n=1 Tax=Ditylenchus dipsaci TaxID=166011 RepID=A0A915ETP3_9BILA